MTEFLPFRDRLAIELTVAGFTPVEHQTSDSKRYIMYTLPDRDPELPYVFDPVCGDCGCLRTECLGPPPFGWDDLVDEDACRHWSDSRGSFSHPLPTDAK